jgi:hypothetical protein
VFCRNSFFAKNDPLDLNFKGFDRTKRDCRKLATWFWKINFRMKVFGQIFWHNLGGRNSKQDDAQYCEKKFQNPKNWVGTTHCELASNFMFHNKQSFLLKLIFCSIINICLVLNISFLIYASLCRNFLVNVSEYFGFYLFSRFVISNVLKQIKYKNLILSNND